MTTIEEQPDYLAYQLRLWRARGGRETMWRASLKSAQTRERRSFASLDDLFDFFRQQTSASPGPDAAEPLDTDGSLSSLGANDGFDDGG